LSQLMLPAIPYGATEISDLVSVWREAQQWTYFLGTYPVYSHRADDQRMFRLVTAQLIQSGACRHKEIIETFGVSKSSVNRALKKLREQGAEAFFKRREGRGSGSVLTPQILDQAQALLDQGYSRRDLADELGVKYDTLRKAIHDGRLRETKPSDTATAKSSRDVVDAQAAEGLGTACTRTEERIVAAFGVCDGAPVRFERCLDVPKGGVLCALPLLLANGLLEGAEHLLGKVKGYYRTFHILLLLAFMALCRIKTVEQLRGHPPGEFGKLLGLDRVPEVRCLRRKLDELSADKAAEQWAVHLSGQWLQGDPEAAGTLYIDGHARVYHGGQTKLPRKYVSRERLCLRGTLDYWVNDALGKPFFVVEKAIDPGMLATLENDIVPRLLDDIPHQPTQQEFEANPLHCRFMLVFDREGYSPGFFAKLWQHHRIACLTYHKHPDEAWPVEWFREQQVTMPSGEIVTMALAEMGSRVGTGKHALGMREVRKLTDSGHQTSLISTAYELPHLELAGRLFSRWCQENFFRYMMQHFAIDLLSEYGTEDFPDTERVVNPAWRERDKSRNALVNKLRYRQARFTEMTMHPEAEDNQARYHKWVEKKADLLEQIQHFEHQLEGVKAKLKQTPKHITWAELEDQDKFYRLLPARKRLMDTVRMIAYRTETAMAGLLTGPALDSAAARRLLQDLFITEADILPEPDNQRLRIRVHGASTPAANRALLQLMEQLNEAEVIYPGTDMRLTYELGAWNG
jgi:transposase